MANILRRSIREPLREWTSWSVMWNGEDRGLIKCWERGREMRHEKPDLAERAASGELPVLVWTGGLNKPLKARYKNGSLQYLAMWQGLRGEDLRIPLDEETEIVCARTGTAVRFTADTSRFSNG
jgi:hypothetical protein